MPHGNVHSEKAAAQNAATPPETPNDKAVDGHVTVHADPAGYVAPDVRDATVAGPAAGELGDYADLDDPSGGMAQGRTNTNREAHAHLKTQGPKTVEANRRMAGGGSSDQGSQ